MITEYELHSDERYVNHENQNYLYVGGIISTAAGSRRLLGKLSEVRKKHTLTKEMRWGKVSNAYLNAYIDWVDAFFVDPYARFVVLEVNRSTDRWKSFRPSQDGKLTSAYYQFLLNAFGRLSDLKRWWVWHDAGFFSRDKVLKRVEFLFNRTYKKAFGPNTSRIIRLSHSLDSSHFDLIQLADLVLAVTVEMHLNRVPKSKPKRQLLEHCATQQRTNNPTQKGLEKLRVDVWVPPSQYAYS